jgi:hypothetical protein
MSDSTPEPSGIQPLPVYEGPSEAYAIDPGEPRHDRGTVTEHITYTSLVVDDRYYDDAIRVQVDGIEKDEPFYLTMGAANSLITMLQRDILKLSRIRQLDPED